MLLNAENIQKAHVQTIYLSVFRSAVDINSLFTTLLSTRRQLQVGIYSFIIHKVIDSIDFFGFKN